MTGVYMHFMYSPTNFTTTYKGDQKVWLGGSLNHGITLIQTNTEVHQRSSRTILQNMQYNCGMLNSPHNCVFQVTIKGYKKVQGYKHFSVASAVPITYLDLDMTPLASHFGTE